MKFGIVSSITFYASEDDAAQIRWSVEEDFRVQKSPHLPVAMIGIAFRVGGHLDGPTALKGVKQLLKIGKCRWIKVKGTKGYIDVAGFKDWLLNSQFVKYRHRIPWLDPQALPPDRGVEWSFQHRSSLTGEFTEVGVCLWSNELINPSKSQSPSTKDGQYTLSLQIPSAIHASLKKLKETTAKNAAAAFVIMKFGKTAQHNKIFAAIQKELKNHNIVAYRADEHRFHDQLYENMLTYLYGCQFGIAVFERIDSEEHNPNVAFEVGFLRALEKPVCLLKDETLKRMPADLMGLLFDPFDTRDAESSIPPILAKWLTEKGFTKIT